MSAGDRQLLTVVGDSKGLHWRENGPRRRFRNVRMYHALMVLTWEGRCRSYGPVQGEPRPPRVPHTLRDSALCVSHAATPGHQCGTRRTPAVWGCQAPAVTVTPRAQPTWKPARCHSAELSHHLCLCDLFSASLCCILMISECKCPSHRTRSGRHLPVTGHRAGTCPHPQDALQCDLQRHPPLEFCGAWFRGHANVGREL